MPYSNTQNVGQPNQTERLGKIVYGTDGTNFWPISVNSSGVLTGTIPNQAIQTDLISSQTIAASTNVISGVVSLTGVKRATVNIYHGRAATAAFTTNGTEYRIEVSANSSGNESWTPIATVLAASAVANSAAASANCAAGTTLITITSGTAMPVTDYTVFTSGTIEWVKPTVATGTASFNILDATTYSHASATGIFSGGEKFSINLNVEAVTRMRAVVNNIASAGTQPIASRVALITES